MQLASITVPMKPEAVKAVRALSEICLINFMRDFFGLIRDICVTVSNDSSVTKYFDTSFHEFRWLSGANDR